MSKKIKGTAIYDIYVDLDKVQPLIDYLETLPRHKPIIPKDNYSKYRFVDNRSWGRRNDVFVRVKIRQEEMTMLRLMMDIKKIVGPV